jgi:DnaJ-class molecular chaperone
MHETATPPQQAEHQPKRSPRKTRVVQRTTYKTCPECEGAGLVRSLDPRGVSPCKVCGGKGKLATVTKTRVPLKG